MTILFHYLELLVFQLSVHQLKLNQLLFRQLIVLLQLHISLSQLIYLHHKQLLLLFQQYQQFFELQIIFLMIHQQLFAVPKLMQHQKSYYPYFQRLVHVVDYFETHPMCNYQQLPLSYSIVGTLNQCLPLNHQQYQLNLVIF